ncbi:hypothetical protein BON30_28075 [Cystobacter ferrugineus]|uniref:Uncharacterized protein n=1 Tax=Cystobacter ferrugineus TaxID=83449 RepID=A0A1L9B4K7_9BACT|nr:hypothetical protein BON30_28075 [Cystobacter ferrugineus]
MLLLVTEVLLGSLLPMSCLARAPGWSPLAFAFCPALGSGLFLAIAGPLVLGRLGSLVYFHLQLRPHEART